MYKKIRLLPVYLIFISVFGMAGLSKWLGGIPPYFEKQFAGSILDLFPGALTVNFYFIALLETVVTLTFILSLVKREFLPSRSPNILKYALVFASFVFVILHFGLILTHDHDHAAQLFFYFTGTIVVLVSVEIIAPE
jgi:hypothetical protein